MRRSTLVMCALLAVGTAGCDTVKEQYARLKARFFPSADTPPTIATGGDTAPTPRAPPVPPPDVAERPPAPQYPTASRPLRDEPYMSPDTGTIDPGMSERDVYSRWGPPVGVRRAGEWTYLYFRNGCEYSCGTYDVVFLQNGVVVDAVLRWEGHGYSGQSSSPPGTVPIPTRGGDTLVVPVTPDT
jgi:hypothetical protein